MLLTKLLGQTIRSTSAHKLRKCKINLHFKGMTNYFLLVQKKVAS